MWLPSRRPGDHSGRTAWQATSSDIKGPSTGSLTSSAKSLSMSDMNSPAQGATRSSQAPELDAESKANGPNVLQAVQTDIWIHTNEKELRSLKEEELSKEELTYPKREQFMHPGEAELKPARKKTLAIAASLGAGAKRAVSNCALTLTKPLLYCVPLQSGPIEVYATPSVHARVLFFLQPGEEVHGYPAGEWFSLSSRGGWAFMDSSSWKPGKQPRLLAKWAAVSIKPVRAATLHVNWPGVPAPQVTYAVECFYKRDSASLSEELDKGICSVWATTPTSEAFLEGLPEGVLVCVRVEAQLPSPKLGRPMVRILGAWGEPVTVPGATQQALTQEVPDKVAPTSEAPLETETSTDSPSKSSDESADKSMTPLTSDDEARVVETDLLPKMLADGTPVESSRVPAEAVSGLEIGAQQDEMDSPHLRTMVKAGCTQPYVTDEASFDILQGGTPVARPLKVLRKAPAVSSPKSEKMESSQPTGEGMPCSKEVSEDGSDDGMPPLMLTQKADLSVETTQRERENEGSEDDSDDGMPPLMLSQKADLSVDAPQKERQESIEELVKSAEGLRSDQSEMTGTDVLQKVSVADREARPKHIDKDRPNKKSHEELLKWAEGLSSYKTQAAEIDVLQQVPVTDREARTKHTDKHATQKEPRESIEELLDWAEGLTSDKTNSGEADVLQQMPLADRQARVKHTGNNALVQLVDDDPEVQDEYLQMERRFEKRKLNAATNVPSDDPCVNSESMPMSDVLDMAKCCAAAVASPLTYQLAGKAVPVYRTPDASQPSAKLWPGMRVHGFPAGDWLQLNKACEDDAQWVHLDRASLGYGFELQPNLTALWAKVRTYATAPGSLRIEWPGVPVCEITYAIEVSAWWAHHVAAVPHLASALGNPETNTMQLFTNSFEPQAHVTGLPAGTVRIRVDAWLPVPEEEGRVVHLRGAWSEPVVVPGHESDIQGGERSSLMASELASARSGTNRKKAQTTKVHSAAKGPSAQLYAEIHGRVEVYKSQSAKNLRRFFFLGKPISQEKTLVLADEASLGLAFEPESASSWSHIVVNMNAAGACHLHWPGVSLNVAYAVKCKQQEVASVEEDALGALLQTQEKSSCNTQQVMVSPACKVWYIFPSAGRCSANVAGVSRGSVMQFRVEAWLPTHAPDGSMVHLVGDWSDPVSVPEAHRTAGQPLLALSPKLPNPSEAKCMASVPLHHGGTNEPEPEAEDMEEAVGAVQEEEEEELEAEDTVQDDGKEEEPKNRKDCNKVESTIDQRKPNSYQWFPFFRS